MPEEEPPADNVRASALRKRASTRSLGYPFCNSENDALHVFWALGYTCEPRSCTTLVLGQEVVEKQRKSRKVSEPAAAEAPDVPVAEEEAKPSSPVSELLV